ncbi:YadA-like family protein [Haemophilus haemolyticus]|jgi:Autotransporter adhesin|uniref:YadA-like family protein n=1 Tax=Haemophilus haemolyticus TaxID=726 RepID=UPI0009BBCA48|nr:YadA-like family protein [Haemophilus haemolyticus]
MEITKQTTPFFQTSCKYLSVFFLASYINYTYAEKETIAVTVEAPKGSYSNKNITLYLGKLENNSDSFAFGDESSVNGIRSYSLGAKSTVKGAYSSAIGYNSNVSGNTSNAIGWNSKIKGDYSNALGRATNIESNYSLALGEAAEAKGGDEIVSIGDYASATGHSTVVIGGYSKIEPLKNGENLVGGKKKVIYDSSTKKISVSSPDLSEEDIIQAYGETYGAMALGYKSSSHSLLATAIGSHATAAGTLSTTTGTSSQALGYHATAYGAHSKVTGDNAGAFGVSTEASGKQSLALGYDSEATAENSVALGAKSVANKENTVSVGSDTLKRKIVNVADGTEDYDAVNVRQLNAVEAKIGGIGNQFANINNHLDRVDTRMNRVGASAAALASLKPENLSVDDKFAVSVGVGNYKNTQAMAVGAVFKPSENVLLNLSGSMSGSEKMLGAGVSWKFGNKSKPAVSTQSAVNSAEVLQLRQEMLAMQKELAELKKALRK